MKHILDGVLPRRAALLVGISFITSVVFVTLVDDMILPNFVVPGDTDALAKDIAADSQKLYVAAIGYLIVLLLDSIIGLGLFVVLKATSYSLALATATLRLLYALTLIVAVFALVLQTIDAYGYASVKLVGYIFFALHIFILGYTVFKSSYLPKTIGVLLFAAAFGYAVFFIDIVLPETILILAMLTMAGGEFSLSVWLIVKRKSLPE